jgi:hypothetical protein
MAEWKKVIVSGSDAELNTLFVENGITGSLEGTSSFSITSSNTILQNNLLSNQNVGGNTSGTEYIAGTPVEEVLRKVLITYIPPTLSTLSMRLGGSAVSPTIRDVGQSFTVNTASFSATADNPNGIPPLSASFTASGADIGTQTFFFGNNAVTTGSNQLSVGSTFTINRATDSGNVTFTVNGRRSDNNALITPTTQNISFRWRNYLAASSIIVTDNSTAQQVVDTGVVSSQLLTSRAYNVTASLANDTLGNFTYLFYPAAYGDLSNIIQNGATPVLGAFNNTPIGDFTITNAFSSSVVMRFYKSNADKAFASGTTLAIT